MSDRDLAKAIELLKGEQDTRTRERFTPIQPFGALMTRNDG